MSFPHSRTNIQKTNPYAIFTLSPGTGCHMAAYVPFNNAYTVTAPSVCVPRPSNAVGQFNPAICGQTMPCKESYMNTKLGNRTVREILTHNKNMMDQYNAVQYMDDPSVMWSTPNQYYNPLL